MNYHPFTSLHQWFSDHLVFSIWSENSAVKGLHPHFTLNNVDGEPLEREITQVIEPEIMVMQPEKPNGVGVLIIPGGSYKRVAFDKEGVDSARELNKKGYTVFIMTYRMPGDGHTEGNLVSLADAQRAVRIIRAKAEQWNLHSLGVIGFSAGGHVASSLATRYEVNTYLYQDDVDLLNARPDFVCLMYPVISMDKQFGHPGSRYELLGENPPAKDLHEFSNENQVTDKTPPCLLIHASDDPAVKVENSLVFWQALKAKNVPCELHLFDKGGHGFGIRDTIGLPVEIWPELFDQWRKTLPL